MSRCPLYDYCCPQGHLFEQLASIADRAQQACPACGQVSDKIPSRISAGRPGEPRPFGRNDAADLARAPTKGTPSTPASCAGEWSARQKLKEKHPELRGDQRPVLAHEGRYHAKPLRAGDP